MTVRSLKIFVDYVDSENNHLKKEHADDGQEFGEPPESVDEDCDSSG